MIMSHFRTIAGAGKQMSFVAGLGCLSNDPAPRVGIGVTLGAFFWAYSGIGIVGISQTVVRSWASLIPEWL